MSGADKNLEKVKEAVEKVVKLIVDNENAVSVSLIEGEQTAIIEVKVDKNDIGKVIGKEGKMIKSLRHLIRAGAMKSGKRVILSVPGA